MALTPEALHEAGQPFSFSWNVDALARGAFQFTNLANVVNAVRLHGRTQIICSVTPNGYRGETIKCVQEVCAQVALDGETFEVTPSGTEQDWHNFVITITRQPANGR